MKYTKAEIRGAILRAADRIERNPRCYDFGYASVGDIDQSGSGCLLSHIGKELSMSADTSALLVAHAIGSRMNGICDYQGHLFSFMTEHFGDPVNYPRAPQIGWTQFPDKAAAGLRAYADKFYPVDAPTLDPAYTSFRASFMKSMEEV